MPIIIVVEYTEGYHDVVRVIVDDENIDWNNDKEFQESIKDQEATFVYVCSLTGKTRREVQKIKCVEHGGFWLHEEKA